MKIMFVIKEYAGGGGGWWMQKFCQYYLFWNNCLAIMLVMFCFRKKLQGLMRIMDSSRKSVAFTLDERRALIRKFGIKGNDEGMKGTNKVLTLLKCKQHKISKCCPFFIFIYL